MKIGNNVKLQNRATIYQGVKIEDNVFVGPHVTFTNDPYPRSYSPDWKIAETLVKKGTSIGAGSIIMCSITIGDYAMIGAGSVVTKNLPPHALAYGDPAKVRGFVCKCGRKLKEEKKNQKLVLMKCSRCDEKYKIPTKDYVEIGGRQDSKEAN